MLCAGFVGEFCKGVRGVLVVVFSEIASFGVADIGDPGAFPDNLSAGRGLVSLAVGENRAEAEQCGRAGAAEQAVYRGDFGEVGGIFPEVLEDAGGGGSLACGLGEVMEFGALGGEGLDDGAHDEPSGALRWEPFGDVDGVTQERLPTARAQVRHHGIEG